MPLYLTHKAAFVHIPKTGGSTVTTELKKEGPFRLFRTRTDENAPRGSLIAMTEYLGDRADEFFKFGFVRNPWDRFVSSYHYTVQRKPEITSVSGPEGFAQFAAEFVKNPKEILRIRYFRPQYRYLGDAEGNSPADFIGRFERFDEDFQKVLDRLGRTRKNVRHRKKSVRSDYRDYYDASLRDAIGEIYWRDVEFYGYSFDDGRHKSG